MTSKERIKKIFDFKLPDRVGVYDQFWNETRMEWCNKIGIKNDYLEDHFGIDIVIVRKGVKPPADKFCFKSIVDPFEDVANAIGLQNLLGIVGADPADAISEFRKSANKTLKSLESFFETDTGIDGAWVWADMAGDKGPFFSPEFYKNYLMPLHRQICAFFEARKLPVVLHSDGNISSILPYIVEAGFKGIHPVESEAGMRIAELKKKYKGKLVFIGNMSANVIRYARDRAFLSRVIKKEIETAKQDGGYIFGFENPISPEVDLDMYGSAIDTVKAYGTY